DQPAPAATRRGTDRRARPARAVGASGIGPRRRGNLSARAARQRRTAPGRPRGRCPERAPVHLQLRPRRGRPTARGRPAPNAGRTPLTTRRRPHDPPPPPPSRHVVHRNHCYSRRRPSTRRTAPEQEIPMTTSLPATITGYPRIGARRELKRALESHWAGRSSEAELAAVAAQVRRDTRQRLSELGLDRENSAIPSD